MNWVITIRNKAGLKTMAFYIYKTQEQIDDIAARLQSIGYEVMNVVKR